MRGGMGPEGKAAPVQLTSAATAMHGGQGVFTTAGKRERRARLTHSVAPTGPRSTSLRGAMHVCAGAKAASPSHGRQASLQPPEPVQLSPAPSFK